MTTRITVSLLTIVAGAALRLTCVSPSLRSELAPAEPYIRAQAELAATVRLDRDMVS